jgi:hypothetical protein
VSDHEFEHEPVPGLPEVLPVDERILWQGAPRWQSLAKCAFRVRGLALYFGVLVLWRVGSVWSTDGAATALAAGLPLLLLSAVALGLLGLLAWLMARATVYTVTSRRVVIRSGIAIPITVNVPYSVIESAAMKVHADGTGDIAIALNAAARVSYVVMWPNVRPWSMAHPQPTLRAIAAPQSVAATLGRALAAAAGDSMPTAETATDKAGRPAAARRPLAAATA